MIYDRTHGPRAGYFGLELRVRGKTDQTETFAANFVSGKKSLLCGEPRRWFELQVAEFTLNLLRRT